MTPLVHPPYEYVSRAPYIVSLEWAGRYEATACPTIYHAFATFWRADFSSPGAPECRLLVDSRGAHILGWRDDVEDIHAWVMTDEMRLTMERLCPQHMELIFDIEMATRGLNVLREERAR